MHKHEHFYNSWSTMDKHDKADWEALNGTESSWGTLNSKSAMKTISPSPAFGKNCYVELKVYKHTLIMNTP